MKKKMTLLMTLVILLISSFGISEVSLASTGNEGINEKLGLPIVVYGEALSDAQKSEVTELLEVNQHEQVDEFTVNGQDLANYIGGN